MKGTAAKHGYKVCSTCLKRKKVSEYNHLKKARDGYNSMCRDCQKVSKIKSLYKTTLKEAKRLYKESLHGECMICKLSAKEHIKRYGKPLYIDHCHLQGNVRGVLCNQCNTALGQVRDNPDILFKMIDYLS